MGIRFKAVPGKEWPITARGDGEHSVSRLQYLKPPLALLSSAKQPTPDIQPTMQIKSLFATLVVIGSEFIRSLPIPAEMEADIIVPAFFLALATPVPDPVEAEVDAREVSDATGSVSWLGLNVHDRQPTCLRGLCN
jgi:hypothetical protein